MKKSVAAILVDKFEEYGIEYIFCVPGASIDLVLDELVGRKPKIIVCHHEATAGYIASSIGKISGKPAVVMVTAGPGATNLVTAVATAYSEHAPIIAITGQMDSRTTFKPAHQVIDAEDMFIPIAKWSFNLVNPATIVSVWDMAYQKTIFGEKGPVHISIAGDLFKAEVDVSNLHNGYEFKIPQVIASKNDLTKAAALINQAKSPLIVVGGAAATDEVAVVLNQLVAKTQLAVACTFEGAGTIIKQNMQHFVGRFGVFQNQPCSQLIKQADLIIAIGYNIAEVDPLSWNKNNTPIVHIADFAPIIDYGYHPDAMLLGDIILNLSALNSLLNFTPNGSYIELKAQARKQLEKRLIDYQTQEGLVHPLAIINALHQVVGENDTVVTDVGSHQYWMSEYFVSHKPRHFLSSMGFQTMGVSLPFAIGAALVRPNQHVFSISGDGSFLMCVMELATAVRLNLPIVHLLWKDYAFNLVEIQEIKKYQRQSGARFDGKIDFAKMAESFGAMGLSVNSSEQLLPSLQKAIAARRPVVIDINIDYADNYKLVN